MSNPIKRYMQKYENLFASDPNGDVEIDQCLTENFDKEQLSDVCAVVEDALASDKRPTVQSLDVLAMVAVHLVHNSSNRGEYEERARFMHIFLSRVDYWFDMDERFGDKVDVEVQRDQIRPVK